MAFRQDTSESPTFPSLLVSETLNPKRALLTESKLRVGHLKAKVEPLSTLGNSGNPAGGDASFPKGHEAPAERGEAAQLASRKEPGLASNGRAGPEGCCTAASEQGGDVYPHERDVRGKTNPRFGAGSSDIGNKPVSRARPFSAARRAAPPLVRPNTLFVTLKPRVEWYKGAFRTLNAPAWSRQRTRQGVRGGMVRQRGRRPEGTHGHQGRAPKSTSTKVAKMAPRAPRMRQAPRAAQGTVSNPEPFNAYPQSLRGCLTLQVVLHP